MAPEVILGMDYDDKSDVFSYGVLLLEFIIGTKTVKNELKRHPYQAFELDLDKVRALAPKSCPGVFLELAIFCCADEPKARTEFKSVVLAFSKILADHKSVDMSPDEIAQSKQLDDLTRASLKVEPEPEDAGTELEEYEAPSSSEIGSRYDLNDLYSSVKGVTYNASSYRSTTSSVGDLSRESSIIQLPGVGDEDGAPPQPASAPVPDVPVVQKDGVTNSTPTTSPPASTPTNNNTLTPEKSTTNVKGESSNSGTQSKGMVSSLTDPIIAIFNHVFTTRSDSNKNLSK